MRLVGVRQSPKGQQCKPDFNTLTRRPDWHHAFGGHIGCEVGWNQKAEALNAFRAHACITDMRGREKGACVCVCVYGRGSERGLRLLCRQRSIALLCGKDNCPRASLNRRASMSGIANSTQPVAMTARGRDKSEAAWLHMQKCSADNPLDPTPEARGWKKNPKKTTCVHAPLVAVERRCWETCCEESAARLLQDLQVLAAETLQQEHGGCQSGRQMTGNSVFTRAAETQMSLKCKLKICLKLKWNRPILWLYSWVIWILLIIFMWKSLMRGKSGSKLSDAKRLKPQGKISLNSKHRTCTYLSFGDPGLKKKKKKKAGPTARCCCPAAPQ